MIVKKIYTVYKPINICKMSKDYWYDELKIEVVAYYLFGLIPLFRNETTISREIGKESYKKPTIQKMKL